MKSKVFQNEIQNNNLEKALKTIDKNSFLKKKRNRLLYYFEKGKVNFLNGNYAESNKLFNQADALIEENKRNIGGSILGVISNPENQLYKGEDFEKVAIHFYKALNYTFLNKSDDALVEAKRVNLQLQQINDNYIKDKKNSYTSDAFALNLQGMLYEASGDNNNAFISYRNAIDLYLKNKGVFFGVTIPKQLEKDFFRTANKLGFTDQVLVYQKKLQIELPKENEVTSGGELIVFWENGLGPYKSQTYYTFSILPGKRDGVATIFNEELNLVLPFPLANQNKSQEFSDIDIFNVAFPKYIKRTPYYTSATIRANSVQAGVFELAQNYDDIALKTLKDRTFREIGKVAIRLAVKKISEYTLKNQNEDLGALLGIVNAITEHADTRNWQSLPQAIYYSRIPLQKGENTIEISFTDGHQNAMQQELKINGTGGLQFAKVNTLKSLP